MNVRVTLRTAAMILCATGLTACGDEEPILILPPATLATCADEPGAPALPESVWRGVGDELGKENPDIALVRTLFVGAQSVQITRDELMLDGYLSLRSAWGDCRAKVDGLDAWMENAGSQ